MSFGTDQEMIKEVVKEKIEPFGSGDKAQEVR